MIKKLLLNKFNFSIIVLVLLFFSGNVNAQTHTITGNKSASTLSCTTFTGKNIISIGDGTTTPSNLIMNADLDLTTCSLGPIQMIINNATIDFTTANKRLYLPEGSSISFLNGGTLNPAGGTGGGCTGNDRIYIGGVLLATCQGGAGTLGFDELIVLGGTGNVASNSPECVGSTINLFATPPPNGGPYTYAWTGPNGFTSTVQNPTITNSTAAAAGLYSVSMTSTTLSSNKTIIAKTTVVVNSLVNNTGTGFSSTSFCAGTQATITFDANNGSGVYPYTLVYENSATHVAAAPVVIANDNQTTFNVVPNPTVTTNYTLLSITDANGCVRTSLFSDDGAEVTINSSNILTGTTWSAGLPPSTGGTRNLIFDSNYNATTDLSGCSCTVNSGVDVTINSGKTLTITNGVTVNGTLSFEDTSSLVQINDLAVNSGEISYSRSLPVLRDTDYVYWSSPVVGQTLIGFSPNTPSDKFYSYDADTDVWRPEISNNTMLPGVGYIIRAPLPPTGATPPGIKPFEGKPNNGVVPLPTINTDYTYLVGNPYPSAVDADLFLDINKTAIEGTIYFWTHATEIGTGVSDPGTGIYAYSGDDYAIYNILGGVGTSGNTIAGATPTSPRIEVTANRPTGKIAAGQGFFVIGKVGTSGAAMFNNSMRVSGNNGQFFKQSNKTKSRTATAIVKNRIWLNLTNTQGLFKQTLVGYVTGATNGIDNAYDGESFDANQYADFYSIVNDKALTIQGRALPFEDSDEVSLGYRSAIAGQLSIKIDQTDGVLSSQDVFIEDKMTNSIHNLKQSAYQFTTAVGTFDDRFVLRYTNASSTAKTLKTTDFKTADNSIVVSNKNKQLQVNSSSDNIDKIMIYDLLGRQIYKKINVDSSAFSISNLNATQQTIIVKVTLQNGQIISKKVIY